MKDHIFCRFFQVRVEWALDGEVSACTKYYTLHYLSKYILCVYMVLFNSIFINMTFKNANYEATNK